MTPSEFCDRWERAFPRAWPIGWHVRREYEKRWARLYTLPEGKRTPATEQELDEVLRRIDAVTEEVIGADRVVEIGVLAAPDEAPSTLPSDLAMLGPVLVDAVPGPLNLDGGDEDERPPMWHASSPWRQGLLATTFREVAAGRFGSVLLYRPRLDEVVSVYEGGVDVIGPRKTLQRIRERFRPWLPDRPDGL